MSWLEVLELCYTTVSKRKPLEFFSDGIGKKHFSKARNAPKNAIQISDIRDKITFLEVFFCSKGKTLIKMCLSLV